MNRILSTIVLLTMAIINIQADDNFIGRQKPEIKDGKLTPEILWAMGRIGSYDVSPDGKSVVYNVSYYSVKQNKSHTVIYRINTDGTGETLLTSTTNSESSPKFYSKGTKITFLSADTDGISQLWMMNTNGSERKQISFLKNDIEDYLFSPDGSKVILIQSVKSGTTTTDLYPDLDKASGRVIDEVMFRHWDEYVESVPHPFLADFNGQTVSDKLTDLLEGTTYECPMKPFGGIEQLAWSNDSKQIAYTCRKKTGLDYAVSTDSDIYLYDLLTKKTKNLCKPDGYAAPSYDYTLSLKDQEVNKQNGDLSLGYDINPQFSPDGKYIAWQSMKHDGYESDRNRLCVYEIATGKKRYVTEKFDSNVDSYCWGTTTDVIYFNGVWHGETNIYRTNLYGEVYRLTNGQYDYTGVALCGKDLVCPRQSMKESPELFFVDGYSGEARQITAENKYFTDNVAWGDVIPRWSKTTDGKELLSWIVLPPNFDKSKKYPTLLFCEGGPQSPVSQFWSYRWNMMIMAANGYVVVAPNRRGLPGFGSKWNEEISTNYGGQCMKDYLSAIDDATAYYPFIDKDRIGCVGASFGGFSVYYLAGNHDKRFKCFIAHDGIFNLEQQYLETEEAWFTNWDLGGAFWHKDNPAVQRTFSASPHLFVDKWDTPILCISGDKDYRILTSQAIAAFNAARYRQIPAELIIFPDENHWVLKPQNGILWQRRFFAWLDKWLKD